MDDEVDDKGLLSAEERMTMAMSCKDYGNDLLKKELFADAVCKYEEGLKHLKDMSEVVGVKEIYNALQLNLSLACMKSCDWFKAIQAADAVLKRDPKNLKALYRRGVARGNNGLLDESFKDLLAVCRSDPSNTEARKHLENVKIRSQAVKQQQAKAFGGLFERSVGLYDDREKERQARKEEEMKRFNGDNEKRKSKGEEPLTFEEWETEETKQANALDKPKTEESDSSPPAIPPPPKKHSPASEEKDEEFDEEDMKIINETKNMGYCYFRKPLTEEDKSVREANLPKRVAAPEVDDQTMARSLSSWNAAGTTYEEKDKTEWCKKRFEERLLEASVVKKGSEDFTRSPQFLEKMMGLISPGSKSEDEDASRKTMTAMSEVLSGCCTVSAKVAKVSNLKGEAHVAVLRGTRRYLFDFHCTASFYVKIAPLFPLPADGSDKMFKAVYKGEILLEDVSSASCGEDSVVHAARVTFKAPVGAHHQLAVDSIILDLKNEIRSRVDSFLNDYSSAPL